MFDAAALHALGAWLMREDGYTLVSHVSPDGDTLGSSLALFAMLRGLGKRAQIVCDQPVPKIYGFLPGAAEVRLSADVQGGFPNVIAVDCADSRRMGSAQALLASSSSNAVIDHHATNVSYGMYNLVDDHAAATAELVFALRRTLGCPLTKEIATCLYVAINTDTGNFAYSNTTPETFRIAAQLLETGIDIARINRLLYRTVPYSKTRLTGIVLRSVQLFAEGQISFASIALEDYLACGGGSADVEGIIDNLRDIDTVEIAILVRAASDGTYKVSLRSKEYADVGAIAAAFGGGGHLRAAGCTIADRPLDVLQANVLEAARAALVRA